jgi:CubicO group peptidase (beta-lactamase class C family)
MRPKRSIPPGLIAAAIGILTGVARADSIDDAVVAVMAQHKIPGLSLAIIDGGKIVQARAYGVVTASDPEPVRTDTLFLAGSISKPVAAVGALQLVDAGRLSLDADVNEALRTWRVPENELTRREKVTVRRLLSHTAGIIDTNFAGYATDVPLPTLEQILNGVKPANTRAVQVIAVPGSEWRYSGWGYVVLQQLMIDVTGESFPDHMRRAVFAPLVMRDSTFAQPLPAELVAQAATGHASAGVPVRGRWYVYPEMAAAGLWTTPSDLARFIIGVQEALHSGRAGAVLSAKLAREMLTRQKQDDGLGFFLKGWGRTQRFQHHGRDEGFDATFTAYCETGQGAVIMINANDYEDGKAVVMNAIATAYRWPGYPDGDWSDRILDHLYRARRLLGVREGVLAMVVCALVVALVIRWRRGRRKSAG